MFVTRHIAHSGYVRMPLHAFCGRMTKTSSSKKPAQVITPAPASSLPNYLQQRDDGCSLAFRAKPGAKVLLAPCGLLEAECAFPSTSSIDAGIDFLQACSIVLMEDAVSIAIDAPAREGEANQAITEYVAGLLELRKHQVSLSKASAKSRDKVLQITGLNAQQALELLRKAAA